MTDDQDRTAEILARLGVTPVEYEAMLCPYYGSPFGPRDMASWTVLEQDGCDPSRQWMHTADDYLAAIYAMIKKNWLTIQAEAPADAVTCPNHSEPRKPEEPPDPGSVVFTKAGYLLHRKIVLAIHGQAFIDRMDSFSIHEPKLQELRFYARTKRHCSQLIHKACQRTSPDSISSLLQFPAEIECTEGPTRIGRWHPSEFLAHPSGYTATARYKRRRRRRRFRIDALRLDSWIESLAPVAIYGTIQGDSFHFEDLPYWHDRMYEDAHAMFRWDFDVSGTPTETAPSPRAILDGESSARGHRRRRNILFSAKEDTTTVRTKMLSIQEAKAILTRCATLCQEQRQRDGTATDG